MGWVIAVIICGLVGLVVGTVFSGASHVSGNISGTAKRRAERRMFWRGFVLPYAVLGAVILIKLALWTRAKWHVGDLGPAVIAWGVVALIGFGVWWLAVPGQRKLTRMMQSATDGPVVPHPVASPLSLAGQLEAAGLRLLTCPKCGWKTAVPPSSGVWCPVCQDHGTHQFIPLRDPQEVR